MRIVITTEAWPEGDGEVARAMQVAGTAHHAWSVAAPHVDVTAVAVDPGGPRLADVLGGARSVVGGAQAVYTKSGLVLSPQGVENRWNPRALATALLGIAADAAREGVRVPVIVPVGDDAPAGDATDLWGGGLAATRTVLASLSLIALTGSQRPLLGFKGMAAATVAGRESDQAVMTAAQSQEDRWFAIAHDADETAATQVLLGPSRLSAAPGTGAAGGLAYCLAAAGASLTQGAFFASDLAGFHAAAEGAELVVAIASDMTPSGLDNGTVAPAAAEAANRGIPCVVIAPVVHVGKRDLMVAGVSAAFAAGAGRESLAAKIRTVAQTWTPPDRTPPDPTATRDEGDE